MCIVTLNWRLDLWELTGRIKQKLLLLRLPAGFSWLSSSKWMNSNRAATKTLWSQNFNKLHDIIKQKRHLIWQALHTYSTRSQKVLTGGFFFCDLFLSHCAVFFLRSVGWDVRWLSSEEAQSKWQWQTFELLPPLCWWHRDWTRGSALSRFSRPKWQRK